MFLNRGGHPLQLPVIKVQNGELVCSPRPARAGPASRIPLRGCRATSLTGSVKQAERTIEFAGARPPKWPTANANAPHKFGKPVELFDGKSMDAWDVQNKTRPSKWTIEDGAMTNDAARAKQPGVEAEVPGLQDPGGVQTRQRPNAPTNSNSGIYLRGRYELQVLDDYGNETFDRGHMSVYGWHTPMVNASKPAGEWQAMEATVVAQQGHGDSQREEGAGQRDARSDHRRRARCQRARARPDHAAGGSREGVVPEGDGDADHRCETVVLDGQ